MVYRRIKSHKMTEDELRLIWSKEYCEKPIITFDGIAVHFFSRMFDHCFYESDNRRAKDKNILSYNRLEKIYWIKNALTDPDSKLKIGWDSKSKSYNHSKRVAIVKDNYIVVILIYRQNSARFITAFEVNDEENLKKILKGPDWPQKKR